MNARMTQETKCDIAAEPGRDVTVRIMLGNATLPEEVANALAAGSVIELDSRLDQQVHVLADGRLAAKGEAVIVEMPRGGQKASRLGVVVREIASRPSAAAGRYIPAASASNTSRVGAGRAMAMAALLAIALCGRTALATGSEANAPALEQTTKPAIEGQLLPGKDTRRVGDAGNTTNQPQFPQLAQTLLALAAVVALIFATRWLLRRMARRGVGGGQSQVMSVLARSAVGPNYNLVLVRLGGRLVLIGCSGTTMSRLAEISDPAEVAALSEMAQAEGVSTLKNLFKPASKSADAGTESSTRQLADKIRRRLSEGNKE